MSAEALRSCPAPAPPSELRLYHPDSHPHPGRSFATAVGRWAWRMAAGAVLCFNFFILSYATSVVVFGWLYRWMQSLVVRRWWQASPRSAAMTYEAFCRSLGADGPAHSPRLFAHDDFLAHVRRPTRKGRSPSMSRLVGRCLVAAVHSLGQNLGVGLRGLSATLLVTAPGCLLMMFSWEFVWLNSFVKGYESAWLGITAIFVGAGLLAAALAYVPMAQAHQATTGRFHSFFDFRTVSRLIWARLGGYTLLSLLALGLSLPLEMLKALPGYFDQQFPFAIRQLLEHQVSPLLTHCFVTLHPGLAEAGNAEVLRVLTFYFLKCAFVLFACLLMFRWASARLYSSAVLECLRRGTLMRDDLDPKVRGYLDGMGLEITPRPASQWGARRIAALTGRWGMNLVLCAVLLTCWLLFASKVYASEFYTYHPFIGFLNHPLVQFPSFDFLPPGLFFTPLAA